MSAINKQCVNVHQAFEFRRAAICMVFNAARGMICCHWNPVRYRFIVYHYIITGVTLYDPLFSVNAFLLIQSHAPIIDKSRMQYQLQGHSFHTNALHGGKFIVAVVVTYLFTCTYSPTYSLTTQGQKAFVTSQWIRHTTIAHYYCRYSIYAWHPQDV